MRFLLKLRTCSFTSNNKAPLSTILGLSLRDPLPDIPNFFNEMDNLVYEHPTEKRRSSYWSLEHVLSGALHRELLSKILVFSVNEPFPDVLNFPPNGKLGLGMRYGDEMRILLKLRTCFFTCATYGTSINDFSFFPDLQWFLRNG